jgi:hypothetical protein
VTRSLVVTKVGLIDVMETMLCIQMREQFTVPEVLLLIHPRDRWRPVLALGQRRTAAQ